MQVSARHRTYRLQRGYSLLELVVVIVIMGLAYTLLPKMVFDGVSGADLRSNARAVATGLRLTRDAAINTRREAVMTLDLESREFSVQNDPKPHKLHEKTRCQTLHVAGRFDYRQSRLDPVLSRWFVQWRARHGRCRWTGV